MNTAPHLPIVEQVAVALCSWLNGNKRPEQPEAIWAALTEEQKVAYREQAQAAIEACNAEEMRRAVVQSAIELETASELVAAHGLDGMSGIFSDAATRNRTLFTKLGVKP